MNVRLDGRNVGVTRDLKIVYEGLARVDGSARFSYGELSSLASVSGPIEVRLAAEQASQATVEVLVRPLSNVPATEAKSYASTIRSSLLPSLILNKHPRSLIQIVVQALSSTKTTWKDSMIASMINSSMLALLNASSVPLRGVVCAAAVGRLPGSEVGMVIDPTEEEYTKVIAGGCFAFIFAEGIGRNIECTWTSWRSKPGSFDEKDFTQAQNMAKVAAQNLYNAIKSSAPWMGTGKAFESVQSIKEMVKSEESDRDDEDDKMEI